MNCLKISKGWKNPSIQRQFFNEFAKKVNIQNFEDWYSISTVQLKKNGGTSILSLYP